MQIQNCQFGRTYPPLRQSILPGWKYSVMRPVVILCNLFSSLSILCLYISRFSTRSFTSTKHTNKIFSHYVYIWMIKASCLFNPSSLFVSFFFSFRLFPVLQRKDSHFFLEPISSGSEMQWNDNLMTIWLCLHVKLVIFWVISSWRMVKSSQLAW